MSYEDIQTVPRQRLSWRSKWSPAKLIRLVMQEKIEEKFILFDFFHLKILPITYKNGNERVCSHVTPHLPP